MKFNPIFYFFLTPLIYSVDGDPYRTYEVLAVALLSSVFFIRLTMYKTYILDIVCVFLFSSFLIIQQFFISNGDIFFGVNFFITFMAAFIPFWMLRSAHWHYSGFEQGLKKAINLVFWVAVLSISFSFFTGFGETYVGGIAGYRAFGFLGDSFSPVMVFLFLFYLISDLKFRAFISLVVIIMMGAKTALIMLVFSVAIYFMFIKKTATNKITGAALAGLLGIFLLNFNTFFTNVGNTEFSMINRLLSYQIGYQFFVESPVFGIGMNQGLLRVESEAMLLAESKGIDNYFPVHQVHNSFLRILSETGLIGFSLFVIFIYVLLSNAFKSIRFAIPLSESIERNIIIAGSIWVIGFVCVYQTTGWFVPGHPQLTWLLMLSTISVILVERKLARKVQFEK